MKEYSFKNHFSSIIEDVFKFIWTILIFIVFSLAEVFAQDIDDFGIIEFLMCIGVIIAIFGIVFVILFIKWRKTVITITETSILMDRKTLFRKSIDIKLKNISTVDISQNLIEKVFKTARVQIDINSIATADDNDLRIILKYDDALEFRKYLLKLINKYEETGNKKMSLENYDYSYSFKDIVKHVIISYNPVVVISLLITFFPIISYSDFNSSSYLIGLLVIIVPLLFGGITNLLKYYNFKIKKDSDKILISYGYFTNKKYTLPLNKVSGIKINQPLFARIFKLYSVELINIGYSDNNNPISLLLPLEDIDSITKKLNHLFPLIDLSVSDQEQPIKAVYAFLIDNVIIGVITVVLGFLINYILGIMFIILWISGTTLSYFTKKLGCDKKYLYITNGVFNKSKVICEIKKIQLITLKKNLVVEKFNLNKMKIGLQASFVNMIHYTGYFEKEKFENIIKIYEKK